MKTSFTKSSSAILLACMLHGSQAFAPNVGRSTISKQVTVSLQGLLGSDDDFVASLDRQAEYTAGGANTEFAQKYRHLVGRHVRTAGEAFAEFTTRLGRPVNALYKGAITDLVGTIHLITVDARFKRDAIWSLGLLESLDLILKNYPEGKEVGDQIVSALLQSTGLDEMTLRVESDLLKTWCQGKTSKDILMALRGEGDSPITDIALSAKNDEFWMYSRYFGVGLVKIMDSIGLAPDQDSAYSVLEEWMGQGMGKSHFSAASDSELYFKTRAKLDMMEMMMKEISIREKKKLAQRLEDKAEAVLRKAERDSEMTKEIQKESEKLITKV